MGIGKKSSSMSTGPERAKEEWKLGLIFTMRHYTLNIRKKILT